jgi:hypothetical protein
MEIKHARSATKHGIRRARSAYVIHNAFTLATLPNSETSSHQSKRTLHLGHDSQGVLIEVMTVENDRAELLVIHAMPMRRRYLPLIDPTH